MLTESLAILEWLDETHPSPPLYSNPKNDPWIRAHIRQLAEAINAGTQPIQNLAVLDYYSDDAEKKKTWARHWNFNGLKSFQDLAQARAGRFSYGDEVTAADLCLIPQCANAIRFGIDLEKEFPLLFKIYQNALETPACRASAPECYEPPT
jgi:maleylacetoacetate isomerase